MSVIPHDFGADKRRATRRFTKLLSLDALHEANVRANPLPYLERASERIYQLEKTIFEAALAARASGVPSGPAGKVEIDAEEYERLRACAELIEAAQKQIEARPDDDF